MWQARLQRATEYCITIFFSAILLALVDSDWKTCCIFQEKKNEVLTHMPISSITMAIISCDEHAVLSLLGPRGPLFWIIQG